MPFIPVPNVIQVEMVYSLNGQVCENVYHYAGATDNSPQHYIDLAAAFHTAWHISLAAYQTQSTYLTAVKITDMSDQNGTAIVFSPTDNNRGYRDTDSVPNNVAAVASWHTLLRGRSFRGRTYLLGLGTATVSGSRLTENTRNELQIVMNNLIAPEFEMEALSLVIVSKFHNKQPRTTGIATPVTSVTVDANLDSQRRRLPGRGK